MAEIVSRKDARAAGLKRYFTGKPCKRGHVAERWIITRSCAVCLLEHGRKWSEANSAKVSAKSAKYRARHGEAVLARKRLRYDLDPKKYYDAARRWEKNHPEQARAIRNAVSARYRANKFRAMPPWLTAEDHEMVACLYDNAVTLSEAAGMKFDVDHIVPLNGETVCGLHVPWNLRVIAASENRSKRNRLLQ
jgi:hypothetical protein